MTVWFTSDLHIGHEKVAEERALGCMICPAKGEAAVGSYLHEGEIRR